MGLRCILFLAERLNDVVKPRGIRGRFFTKKLVYAKMGGSEMFLRSDTMIEVIGIDKQMVLAKLGLVGSEPDEVMTGFINEACDFVKNDASVSYVCGIYDILKSDGEGILLDECKLTLKGETVAGLLEGCEKAVIIAASLSAFIDTRLSKLRLTNLPLSLVYDNCADVALDQVISDIQGVVSEAVPGYINTEMIMPGGGDFSKDILKPALEILEAKDKAGILLGDNNQLGPSKTRFVVYGLKDISKLSLENISAVLPEGASCGNEAICSHCRHKDSCEKNKK